MFFQINGVSKFKIIFSFFKEKNITKQVNDRIPWNLISKSKYSISKLVCKSFYFVFNKCLCLSCYIKGSMCIISLDNIKYKIKDCISTFKLSVCVGVCVCVYYNHRIKIKPC